MKSNFTAALINGCVERVKPKATDAENKNGDAHTNTERGTRTRGHRERESSILRSADIALYRVDPPLRPIKSTRVAKKS